MRRISAAKEVGKAFCSRRERCMWYSLFSPEEGERVMVHASSFLNRRDEEEVAAVEEVDGAGKRVLVSFVGGMEERRDLCWDSSQRVSQRPEEKSWWERMERRIGMLVAMPVMRVSSRARRALAMAAGKDEAVTMSLAMRLSKSGVMEEGMPETSDVSHRMPLPEGKWKDWILPTLSVQFLVGSSAVIRSWIDCDGGGVKGSFFAGTRPVSDSEAP